eukprot:250065_1
MNSSIFTVDLLDVICEHRHEFSEQHLFCIYKMDKNLSTKERGQLNAYWVAIDLEKKVSEMIRYDKSLIDSCDTSGDNVLDHYRLTPYILTNQDHQQLILASSDDDIGHIEMISVIS